MNQKLPGRARLSGRRLRQQGVALFVSLMILLIISVIGIAAMRSSTFSAKVAMGTQLDAMVFEAAESGIAVTMAHLVDLNASDDAEVFDEIAGLFNGLTITWCIAASGELVLQSCGANQYMDARNALLVETRSRAIGFSPASGNQISSTGGMGTIIGDFELLIQGNGSMPGYNMSNRHIQHALRRGMIPAQEF
ncbi:MAG: hypothetical protein LAT61_14420 [Alcanivorax sp.]|nr:hypothetical protein [Alcanivorax sp.]